MELETEADCETVATADALEETVAIDVVLDEAVEVALELPGFL